MRGRIVRRPTPGTGVARALTALAFALAAPRSPAIAQTDSPAQAAIRATLTQWMADFNAREGEKICALFAPDLIAQVRGVGERGYAAQCDVLKRSLADKTRSYRYALTIKEILVADAGDLAFVRLTWTLTVTRADGGRTVTYDEPGLDVFRHEADGSWKLMRFQAYDTAP